MAAISTAISCITSMSRPRTCTEMPLPPMALISMEEVSITISASFFSQISAISSIISAAIVSLSFSFSALKVRYSVVALVAVFPLPVSIDMEDVDAIAPTS